jgi:hypothetical protein
LSFRIAARTAWFHWMTTSADSRQRPSSESIAGRQARLRRIRSWVARPSRAREREKCCKNMRCTFQMSCGPRSSRGLPVRTARSSHSNETRLVERVAAVAASRSGRIADRARRRPGGSRRGAGHGVPAALRASIAGRPATRRLAGTSRMRSPDANHVDRPDPEIIPVGPRSLAFFPARSAVVGRRRTIPGRDRGVKQPHERSVLMTV